MHEYQVTKRIIQIAEQYARENGARRVAKVHLTVGEASGVAADCVRLYFDLIAAGTICENAVLEIQKTPSLLRCKVCGALFARKPFSFQCTEASCGGEGEPTETGREFLVKTIETE